MGPFRRQDEAELSETATFVISVAAQLAGMHPQTLRQYDRLGLVSPARTKGQGRRYSRADVALLREVQRLSQEEGVNLAGISRIIELEHDLARAQNEIRRLRALTDRERLFHAGPSGEVSEVRSGQRRRREAAGVRAEVAVARSAALVLWRERGEVGN